MACSRTRSQAIAWLPRTVVSRPVPADMQFLSGADQAGRPPGRCKTDAAACARKCRATVRYRTRIDTTLTGPFPQRPSTDRASMCGGAQTASACAHTVLQAYTGRRRCSGFLKTGCGCCSLQRSSPCTFSGTAATVVMGTAPGRNGATLKARPRSGASPLIVPGPRGINTDRRTHTAPGGWKC